MMTRQFGSYHVQQKIGAGTLSAVYRAQTADGKAVALKMLHRELAANATAVEAFLAATAQWSALTHPHLLPLLDAGVLRERPYAVTALAVHGSLTIHFTQLMVMSLQHSARLLRQISSALEYLHRQGIAHTRLKPSNIMVDTGGNWLLTDVGMSAVQQSAALPNDLELAFFAFPQPPQDKQADLYALAVLTYWLTTGQMPYQGTTVGELENAHLHETPARPSTLHPALAADMDTVLLRGLAKQPKTRYVSADAFVEAYARAISAGRPAEIEIMLDAVLVPAANEAFAITTDIQLPSLPTPPLVVKPAVEVNLAAAAENSATQKSPSVPMQPLKRVRRRRKRTLWGTVGILGFIILSITSTYIVLNIAGIGGEIINFVTGDQPIAEVEGTPVELIDRPVLVVPPSTSSVLRSEDTQTNTLTDGHVHEYGFEVNNGDEVLIGVQFFAPTVLNVPDNVAVFAPDGTNADRSCDRQPMLDAQTGIGLICRISSGGVWTVRIFGREGESTGAYAVSLVVN